MMSVIKHVMKRWLTVGSISSLLTALYLLRAFDNIHLLVSPLTHRSTASLVSSASSSGRLVHPVFSSSASVDVSVSVSGAQNDPPVVLWQEVGAASFLVERGGVATRRLVLVRGEEEECQAVSTSQSQLPTPSFSTDVLEKGLIVTVYQRAASLFSSSSPASSPSSSDIAISIPSDSFFWSAIDNNSTLTARASLRLTSVDDPSLSTLLEASVSLVKYMEFVPPKRRRFLGRDLLYLLYRLVPPSASSVPTTPPWVLPPHEAAFSKTLILSHLKPSLSVKLVADSSSYPFELSNGLNVKRAPQSKSSDPKKPSEPKYVYMPDVYFDELTMTRDSYVALHPVGGSSPPPLSRLSLVLSLDPSLSPARSRLMKHMTAALKAPPLSTSFSDNDVDELRHLIADTSLPLLGATVFASTLHLLFEFLAAKSEVSFWSSNASLTGLSVRHLFLDLLSQFVVMLFLIEEGASLLVTVPAGVGVAIAAWKCRKAAGLRVIWRGWLPWLVASRMGGNGEDKGENDSLELDATATRYMSCVLIPLVTIYALFQFFFVPQCSWYGWLLGSLTSCVYALGFLLMTPQLFLNHKLKTVAHLPWRVLCFRFVNTFIDDLFAFLIRMPTLARIGCLRDDVVFFIYLYQRWIYRVDETRPVEGGEPGEVATETASSNSSSSSIRKAVAADATASNFNEGSATTAGPGTRR